MKTNKYILILSLLSFSFVFSYGQLDYSTDFENATDRSLWSFGTSAYPCGGGNAEEDNCWSADPTVEMINSTSLGNSSGCASTVQFDYKIVNYGTNTGATASDLNTLMVYSGASSTGPWTLRYTLPSHVSSSTCATKSFTYTHPVGATFLMFETTWAAGDWDIIYDNISIIEDTPQASITKTCSSDLSSYDLEIEVTDLGPASSVDITDGTTTYETNVGLGTYTISGLTADETIYVIQNGGGCQYSEAVTKCDICTDAPSLPEDECVDAPLIDLSQPFAGSTNCSYTPSAGSPAGCGSIENDSWMTFIAGSSDVEMEFEVGACTTSGGSPAFDGIQLIVFSGSCGSLSELAGSCVNPINDGQNSGITGTWNFSGLTIGDTYYIRIDGYAGQLCDYWFTPISGVVITPDNDLCPDADTLICGGSDIASNILATADDAPSACSGGGTAGKGVWYMFEGTGQEITISTDNAGTNFDTDLNIYEGPCGSLNCIGGDTDSGTGTTSSYTLNTTNGVDYYIYVDGNGSAEGQFEISITCSSCDADAGTWN